jgi:hypothetical protein
MSINEVERIPLLRKRGKEVQNKPTDPEVTEYSVKNILQNIFLKRKQLSL